VARHFARLTPNLWVAQSRLFHMNSSIFISDGEACLVDPGIYPDEIEGIAAFLREQVATPRAIVLSHIHWDHILGPERFPGVQVIAHARFPELAKQYSGYIVGDIAGWEAKYSIERSQPFAIPRPDVTFEVAMTLNIGSITLQLSYAPGHSPDQVTVYHPESAALCAADMLSDLETPFADYSLEAFQRTMASLSELDIRVLVPGHGHATTDPGEIRARMLEDISYLAEVRTRVERALREGKTVEEVVERCADIPYRNRAENEHAHAMQVQKAYAELSGQEHELTL
jgi:hydroxyacylglutathione hydrolase